MSVRNPAKTASSISSKPPAMNSAFKAQSRKEQEKLKGVLAEQLSQDMKRLLDEGTFSDLSLVVESKRISVHSQLLQTRLAEFFSCVVELQMTDKEREENMADLSTLGVTAMELKNLLRAIYTEDNVGPYWNAFQDAVRTHDSLEPMECGMTANDADDQMCVAEQSLTGVAGISAKDKTDGQVRDNLQDTDSVGNQKETEDENIGDQSAAAASLAVKVCEHATLESVQPAAGHKPGTAPSKISTRETRKSDHPRSGVKSAPHKSGSGSRGETSAYTLNGVGPGIGLKEQQRTSSHPVSNRSSVGAKPQEQSFSGTGPLPPAACRLGRDLLHMFARDSAHDIIIKVDGKEIPAHRFMLCARSQYFSAMLEGSWRESNSSEIEIKGFSHAAVMLALQFIYGGAYDLPDGAILKDVLCLVDMHGLDTLKDVVEFKLRKDYCHFFHKPCTVCLARIPECLVLMSGIELSDLEECILSWLVQYLDRAWREKTFASLPQELLFKCRERVIQSFSRQTAIPLLLQIDKLVCSLPQVQWAKAIHSTALHLQDACTQYVATNFLFIIGQESFRNLLEGMNWKKDLVEPVFSRVVSTLTTDTANATFVALHFLRAELMETCDLDHVDMWNPDAVAMVDLLYSQCYSYMVSNASLMVQAVGWNKLPSDLRERIKEEGVFIDSRGRAPARRPVLTSSLKGKTKTGPTGSKGS